MSTLATPATRALPVVLRQALQTDPSQARLLILTTGPALADPEGNAYANVIREGVTVKIPRLAGSGLVEGGPAYCLAIADFLLYLGTCSTLDIGGGGEAGPAGPPGPTGPAGPTGPTGATGPSGASTFLSGSGAPTAGVGVDGSIYLDTASGRVWGPKAAGAWPGAALGRIVPLAPTWAQLKTG